MNKKSTSLNKICADKKMSFLQHFVWLITCFIDNLFSHSKYFKLQPKKYIFDNNNIDNYFNNNIITETPSRICCDLFWNESLKNINKKVNILEVGCGTGKYAKYLLDKFPNKINAYTGIDIKQCSDWDNIILNYTNTEFHIDTYENVDQYLDNIDIIITQSAIEHFEYDILFFDKILNYINNSDKNISQIHLFPSAPCLHLYFWHGYRQYTPRNLMKIVNLSKNFEYNLYELGGPLLNSIHFNFVTFQKLFKQKQLRFTDNISYSNKLMSAFKISNHKFEISKSPSFYALLINKKS